MTRTEIERLAVVEDKVDDIKDRMERMEALLHEAVACKADKTEVEAVAQAVASKASAADFTEMRKLLIGVLLGVAGFTTVTLIAIVLMRVGLQ